MFFLLTDSGALDPWGAPVPSSETSGSSPWGGSPVPAPQTTFDGFDSGTSSLTNGGNKATVEDDDDFDLLSSRSTADSPAKATVAGSFDPLGSKLFHLELLMNFQGNCKVQGKKKIKF